MAKGQRAQKYEPERVARILAALRVGGTFAQAAACGGISVDTFARWRTRYPAFGDAAERAAAAAEIHALAVISAASATDWRAAAWWLERRHPERYGRGRRAEAPPLEPTREATITVRRIAAAEPPAP